MRDIQPIPAHLIVSWDSAGSADASVVHRIRLIVAADGNNINDFHPVKSVVTSQGDRKWVTATFDRYTADADRVKELGRTLATVFSLTWVTVDHVPMDDYEQDVAQSWKFDFNGACLEHTIN